MKLWIVMITLALGVCGLCVWDCINTNKIFNHMESESAKIYSSLTDSGIEDPEIGQTILNLNEYWTKKMDILSVSISRKDLQPVSDYLQYLCSSITNENQEDSITYSRLLNYNIIGLKESNGLCFLNLL